MSQESNLALRPATWALIFSLQSLACSIFCTAACSHWLLEDREPAFAWIARDLLQKAMAVSWDFSMEAKHIPIPKQTVFGKILVCACCPWSLKQRICKQDHVVLCWACSIQFVHVFNCLSLGPGSVHWGPMGIAGWGDVAGRMDRQRCFTLGSAGGGVER